MNWLEQSKANLLPLSQNRSNVAEALKEWQYTGNTFDLEEPVEQCQLCGYEPIRYQFEIENLHTSNSLLVGSECINRFQITGIDEYGNRLDADQTRKKVGHDPQKLITDAKTRRMMNTLVKLAVAEQTFEIQKFISYFDERGAFTPNQLSLLLWRMKVHHIDYHPTDFKLTIRRDREKSQLTEMEDFKMNQLRPCMSASQKKWFDEYRANLAKRRQMMMDRENGR